MSSVLVKLQRKGQMVIPRALRDQAGVAEGTLMKIAVIEGGQLLITPQVSIDRSIVSPAKSRKQALREFAATVDEIRQEAKVKGIAKMSQRQINAAVASARLDRSKKSVKPTAK